MGLRERDVPGALVPEPKVRANHHRTRPEPRDERLIQKLSRRQRRNGRIERQHERLVDPGPRKRVHALFERGDHGRLVAGP